MSKYDPQDVPQLYLCCYRFRSESQKLEYENVHIPLRLSLFRRVKGPTRMKSLLENRDFSYTLHKLYVAVKKLIETRDSEIDDLIEDIIKKFYANDSSWRNKIVEIAPISQPLLVRFYIKIIRQVYADPNVLTLNLEFGIGLSLVSRLGLGSE